MKILFTTSFFPPYHVGGDATHVKYLAEALAKEGHDVHVMFSIDAYKLKRKEQPEMPKSWNDVKVHIIEAPSGKLEPIFNYIFGTQKYTYNFFKRLIEKEKFDVIHHHNISLLGYGILKKIGNYKNIYTAHDYWLICHKYDYFKFGKICNKRTCFTCTLAHRNPYLFHRLGKNFKNALNDIDLIISPSKFMKTELKKYLDNKIEVIYNFVPEAPKKLPHIQHKDYFLFVGQLEKHKGILELIEIFKEIPNKKLLIVGEGSLSNKIKKIIKKCNNVKYLEWKSREEVLAFMKNANALILPSKWGENMPMVIIESLSVGTSTIATNVGGISEITKKVDSNLLFEIDDFKKLIETIKNFKRKISRKKIIKIFKENYSIKIYNKMLKKVGYFDEK